MEVIPFYRSGYIIGYDLPAATADLSHVMALTKGSLLVYICVYICICAITGPCFFLVVTCSGRPRCSFPSRTELVALSTRLEASADAPEIEVSGVHRGLGSRAHLLQG